MAKDEIYERYLERSIAEINELGDEIARCGLAPHAQHQPVLGSGHPLADIFLLKYAPGPAEVNEGVAFYGRVGQALLKSVQRLGIDPLLIYGTNCVKCGDVDDALRREVCPAWLRREFAIVQPRIVVVMGEDALEVLNGLELPLSQPIAADPGVLQRLTPTVEALWVPSIEGSLDDQAAKRRFWDAFRTLGEWYAALPPY